MRIVPLEIPVPKRHQYLLGAISPRPIAFASTMDKDGNPNLAPFSFFNLMGSNPPIAVFSPALSGRDKTTKGTLDNILQTKEVVINIVNWKMVRQMSLASAPFAKGVNEFIKSGLTPIPSELIKPFRVKESYVQFECKMRDVIKTGTEGAAGNIVICEIILMHIDDAVLDEEGKIDPYKMDYVARMGGSFYNRVIPESIFELTQPKDANHIGVDALPESIRLSKVLTGNNIGQLGTLPALPDETAIKHFLESHKELIANLNKDETAIHIAAKQLLHENKVEEAVCLLLAHYQKL
ncbi:MAG: flavin reductase family protein [Chitinophagales bacterium]|nr:flavin reductase family protein [Bacteroidota bacterium]MBP7399548.1 flavin reductase family protein [Chitinophagales bacterium]MBK8680865.1 flavin reductase family protein [Bacteroidota bacterium]MBP8754483.1 flavin reductase family protein [Chitinophagales bacterium]MBP9190093.1 flavin reductase family protein [Chitinophagales bacterium]